MLFFCCPSIVSAARFRRISSLSVQLRHLFVSIPFFFCLYILLSLSISLCLFVLCWHLYNIAYGSSHADDVHPTNAMHCTWCVSVYGCYSLLQTIAFIIEKLIGFGLVFQTRSVWQANFVVFVFILATQSLIVCGTNCLIIAWLRCCGRQHESELCVFLHSYIMFVCLVMKMKVMVEK